MSDAREQELRAQTALFAVLERDRSSVKQCDFAYQVQAQARALLACVRSCQRVKALEYTLARKFRDAGAFVLDAHAYLSGRAIAAHFEARPYGTELDGVLDQVGQREVQEHRISLDLERGVFENT